MIKHSFLAMTLAMMTLLGGCGTRQPVPAPSSSSPAVQGGVTQRVKDISAIQFTTTADAEKALANNENFSLPFFVQEVEKKLSTKQHIAQNASQHVEVVLTQVRLRHPSSVAFGGLFSGKDRVIGRAKLVENATGKVLKEEELEANFGITLTFKFGSETRTKAMASDFADEVMGFLSE